MFKEFTKIARLSRECVVTEKIDGTNGQILIVSTQELEGQTVPILAEKDGYGMLAGSRTRFLSLTSDNFSFARWATDNADELFRLGPGQHFGEWWGRGIQRGYELKEKRFSLFNTTRWTAETKPAICSVVPELYRGPFVTEQIDAVLENLRVNGSAASPGFMNPEGIIVYHMASNTLFKKTLENDGVPKSLFAKT